MKLYPKHATAGEGVCANGESGEGKVLGAKIPPPRGGRTSRQRFHRGSAPRCRPAQEGERPILDASQRDLALSYRPDSRPGRGGLVWDAPTLALWLLGVVVVSDWLDSKISDCGTCGRPGGEAGSDR